MSFCLSFVIICTGYLGDYSPPFTSLRSVTVGWGRSWGEEAVGGSGFCCSFFLFYRVPTIILWIFFLFSFFLFNFVPIIKEIRTINKKDSANEATTELANTVFIVWSNDCYCIMSLCFAFSFLCGGTEIVVSLQTNYCL